MKLTGLSSTWRTCCPPDDDTAETAVPSHALFESSDQVRRANSAFFSGGAGFNGVVFGLGADLVARYGSNPSEEEKAEFRVIWMQLALHGNLSI